MGKQVIERGTAEEEKRLQALRRYKVLDTEAESVYDALTKLASYVCGTPISLVSLIDADRQWSKSQHGINAGSVPRDISFCTHAIENDEILYISDATKDPRFASNPLVIEEPNIRFYAGAPLKAPCGSILGTICVVDFKPRELNEQQLDALSTISKQVIDQFELRITNIKLENESEIIKDLIEERDQLMYSLSHDLRGAFSSIIGLSDLLTDNVINGSLEDAQEVVKFIKKTGETSLQLLEDVLQWSMNRDDRGEFEPVSIKLRRLVDSVRDVLDVNFARKKQKVRISCDQNLWVKCDEHMLFSVLYNLLSNACKFTPEGGTLSLEAKPMPGVIEIFVIDNGVGMSQDRLNTILSETQVQSIKGTAGERGTGLGLLLCKKFVERNNGTIQVRSELNKGTTFRLKIPSDESADSSQESVSKFDKFYYTGEV